MKTIEQINIIKGGIASDERGSVSFVNGFDMSEVKRFYKIQHNDTITIRAWQGHKIEQKWFYCTKGKFEIKSIRIDNWEKPASWLKAKSVFLTEKESSIFHLPGGHVSGIKALEAESILMVFSNQDLEASKKDDFRFDKDYWFNWEQ